MAKYNAADDEELDDVPDPSDYSEADQEEEKPDEVGALPSEAPPSPQQLLDLDKALAAAKSPQTIRDEQNAAMADYQKRLADAQKTAGTIGAVNSLALAFKPLAERQSATDLYYGRPQQSSGISEAVNANQASLDKGVANQKDLLEKFQAAKEKQAENEINYVKGLLEAKQKAASVQAKIGAAASAKGSKEIDAQNKARSEFGVKMSLGRGTPPAVTQADTIAQAAKRARAIAEGTDPNTGKPIDANNLSTKMLNLFNAEVEKVATGGVPTESGRAHIMPANLETAIADIKNFMASKPTPAQAGAYIKEQLAYLKDVEGISSSKVRQYREDLSNAYEPRLEPGYFASTKKQYGLFEHNPELAKAPPQAQPPMQMAAKPPMPAPDLASAKPSSPPGMVRVKAPSGDIKLIPQAMVNAALANGGKLVP